MTGLAPPSVIVIFVEVYLLGQTTSLTGTQISLGLVPVQSTLFYLTLPVPRAPQVPTCLSGVRVGPRLEETL